MNEYLAGMLIIGGILVAGIAISVFVEKAKKADNDQQRRKLASRSDFTATVVRGPGFTQGWGVAIDEQQQKFAFVDASPNPKIFDFGQLVAVEVQKNGQSVTKTNRGSQVGGAVVGAMLLGPAGLLLGGLTGRRTTTETIQKLSLVVHVSDFTRPTYEVVFFKQIGSAATKEADLSAQMGELNAWFGRFHTILAMNTQEVSPIAAMATLTERYATKERYVSPTPVPVQPVATGSASLKWQTLVEIDKDIQAAVAEVRPLGKKYEEELAQKFVALMDKTYLPAIVQNLKEKAEAGIVAEEEAATVSLDDYRKAVARNGGKEPTYNKLVLSSELYDGPAVSFQKGLRVMLEDGECVLVAATSKRIFKSAHRADTYAL